MTSVFHVNQSAACCCQSPQQLYCEKTANIITILQADAAIAVVTMYNITLSPTTVQKSGGHATPETTHVFKKKKVGCETEHLRMHEQAK